MARSKSLKIGQQRESARRRRSAQLQHGQRNLGFSRKNRGRSLVSPPLIHSGAVFSVAFSPDGTHVVTGTADGFIYIWDVSPTSIRLPDTTKLAEFFAGQRVNSSGAFIALSRAELKERWAYFSERFPRIVDGSENSTDPEELYYLGRARGEASTALPESENSK